MKKALSNLRDAFMGLALRIVFVLFILGVAVLLLLLHLEWVFFYKEDEYG